MIVKRYLNLDGAQGGGSPKMDFSFISNEGGSSTATQDPPADATAQNNDTTNNGSTNNGSTNNGSTNNDATQNSTTTDDDKNQLADENPFKSVFDAVDSIEPSSDGSKPLPTTDVFKNAFTKFGIELDENINEDVVYEKLNTLIENSKQKLDLTKYSPETQMLIEHLETSGSLTDFYRNDKIRQLDSYLSLSTLERYAAVRSSELNQAGTTDVKTIQSIVDDEINTLTENEIVEKLKAPDGNARRIIKTEYESIYEKTKSFKQSKETERLQARTSESKQMLGAFSEMKDFLGIPIDDNNRGQIAKLIESGKVSEYLERNMTAKAKLTAFMEMTLGDKARQALYKKIEDDVRKAHNEGRETIHNAYHNVPNVSRTNSHVVPGQNDKGKFGGLRELM